jgi:hypothetical protein
MLWCFYLYFNFVATCFWVEPCLIRPSGITMNKSSKKLLFRYIIFLSLISHAFSLVSAQNNEKSADTAIYPVDSLKQPIDSINYKDYEIVYDTVYVPGDTIHNTDTLVVYLKNIDQLKFSADFSYSAFYSFADIGANSETYNDYANKRQTAVSPLMSYQVGGRFNVQKKHNSLSLGVGIKSLREVQNYPDSWVKNTTTYSKLDTIDSYYDITGIDTTWHYVTQENEYSKIDSSLNKNSYKNHYLYFEIPIIYGYNKDFKKFSISLQAGLLLDFLLNVSGKTISEENTNDYTNISKDKRFKDFNISLYLGAKVLYPLNKRVCFIFEPFYIKGFNSLYRSDNPIYQKLHSYGIRYGLQCLL